jgi:uncharacterized membrane protein YeaQ/YmgE (transglycosylase-associated protein family)
MPDESDSLKTTKRLVEMIGAIILGLVAGFIARLLVPNDVFSRMGGVVSWILTLVVGLAGAMIGYFLFTGLLGIGDDDMFDLGGILGAIAGAVILLVVLGLIFRGSRRDRTCVNC